MFKKINKVMFINCNKCTTLVSDDNVGGYACVGKYRKYRGRRSGKK